MFKIGHFNTTRYWQKYAFATPPEGCTYKRAIDIPWHLTNTNNQFLLNTKWVVPFQGFDLLHTYNSIIPYNIPWIVEVESLLPRYDKMDENSKLFKWAINRLKSDSCRKILFVSESTRQLNEQRLLNWGISKSKMEVLYRAVEQHPDLSHQESTFNILFAGNGFYRKGGLELLKAFVQVKDPNIRLTIISSFEIDWAIFPTQDEINWVKNTIANDKRVSVKSNLPHQLVIAEMQKAQVFVTTTYADPFNNTILEAMACGTAIIASNERAIPEFVTDNKNGYLIDNKNISKKDISAFIKEKIEQLYYDHKLLKEMITWSSKIANSKFSIQNRNQNLTNIINGK